MSMLIRRLQVQTSEMSVFLDGTQGAFFSGIHSLVQTRIWFVPQRVHVSEHWSLGR